MALHLRAGKSNLRRKIVSAAVVLALAVGSVFAVRAFRDRGKVSSGETASGDPRAKGDPKAEIRIIEYTDFQCPACGKGFRRMKEILAAQPERFYLEYHPFPLTRLHPYALRMAVYAECAARQDRFWPLHDLLFEHQEELHGALSVERRLEELAARAGLDEGRLRSCVEDPAVEEGILEERAAGAARGVHATPTYFINGKMIVGTEDLRKALVPSRRGD